MKRESQVSDLWPHRSWFAWKLCCNCKKEFRREVGWRAFTGPYMFGHGLFRYICGSCAPTRAIASDILRREPWVPAMPKCKPPALPPRPSQGDWILVKGVRVPRLYPPGDE